MGYQEDFCSLLSSQVQRHGVDKLLEWLAGTDFFRAPASTRFHGACEQGLVMHSLNVYHALMDRFFEEGDNPESMAICGLLHDLCKANYYKAGTRNVKNEATGQWEKAPFYSVEDLFPYGHGEKSVFLIERFMKLKVEDVSELTTKTARLPPASPSFESSSSSWSVRLRSCGTEKGMSRVLQLMRMPFMVLPAASLKAL